MTGKQETSTASGPSSASAIDASNLWFYKDNRGVTHGPHTSHEMFTWLMNGFFDVNLMVRKEGDNEFLPLMHLTQLQGQVPFVASPNNTKAVGPPPSTSAITSTSPNLPDPNNPLYRHPANPVPIQSPIPGTMVKGQQPMASPSALSAPQNNGDDRGGLGGRATGPNSSVATTRTHSRASTPSTVAPSSRMSSGRSGRRTPVCEGIYDRNYITAAVVAPVVPHPIISPNSNHHPQQQLELNMPLQSSLPNSPSPQQMGHHGGGMMMGGMITPAAVERQLGQHVGGVGGVGGGSTNGSNNNNNHGGGTGSDGSSESGADNLSINSFPPLPQHNSLPPLPIPPQHFHHHHPHPHQAFLPQQSLHYAPPNMADERLVINYENGENGEGMYPSIKSYNISNLSQADQLGLIEKHVRDYQKFFDTEMEKLRIAKESLPVKVDATTWTGDSLSEMTKEVGIQCQAQTCHSHSQTNPNSINLSDLRDLLDRHGVEINADL